MTESANLMCMCWCMTTMKKITDAVPRMGNHFLRRAGCCGTHIEVLQVALTFFRRAEVCLVQFQALVWLVVCALARSPDIMAATTADNIPPNTPAPVKLSCAEAMEREMIAAEQTERAKVVMQASQCMPAV